MATAKKTTTKTVAKKAPSKAPAKKAVAKKTVAAAEKPAPKAAATEAVIYSAAGAKAGTIQLPAELFAAPWRADLVHQVVIGMQANARPTVAHTKFRGEVSGGGKKPWKQKGTGRARHGSSRSPIWRGGGVTHGPRAEKVYAVKINRKMRTAALASVLSRKWKDGEILFVDSLSFAAPKTSEARAALVAASTAAGMPQLVAKRKNAAVLALSKKDANTEKSFRNMSNILTEEVRNLNPVDLMNKRYLIIENPVEALPILSARLTK
ncbi:MAG TPA: 50S ribosomal protein L4 [Candidatus Paceibacterota bacterium]|nr:50S ribosomal protein L4 [Candidatus Paceibacterota bacterium]